MKILQVKDLKMLSILTLLMLLIGCATTGILTDKNLLDFLEDGQTTKVAVVLKLGQPSGSFEKEKIITYKIGSDDNKGYYLIDRPTGWGGIKYSLVLIFDDNNVLQKHSLVQVR